MLNQIETQTFISGMMDFLFILVFCLVGSIVKDTYNILTDKDYKVQIQKILVSTIVSSIVIFSFSDYLLEKMSWKLFILPCFIGGTVGFELIGKISNLRFWLKFLIDKKSAVDDLIEEEKNKEASKTKNEKKIDIKDDG